MRNYLCLDFLICETRIAATFQDSCKHLSQYKGFPGSPVVMTEFNPSWGTKILQTTWYNLKKKLNYYNPLFTQEAVFVQH